MRNTLIFKGIQQHKNERSWENTEAALIDLVIKRADVHPDTACKIFERVHRGEREVYIYRG